MKPQLLLYLGSIIIFLWGAAHIFPTRAVVNGFGPISMDNKRIITMEWIAEGLALCFLGILVFVVTWMGGTNHPIGLVIYRLVAGMLFVMVGLTTATGARTSIIPIRICPLIKTVTGLMILSGSFL